MAATYTVKQVAEILGYSTNSIYTFLKEKRIKGVRVGSGRFRIPQSELNRLLLISKGQTASGKETGNGAPAAGTLMMPDTGIITPHESRPPFSLSFFGRIHTVTANIFDWFIGVSALIAGIALFLFNKTFDLVHVTSITPIMPAVRILLTGGGIGILLTNFLYDSHRAWHRVFHGVLVVAGFIMTTFVVMTRDFDAAALYGVLTFCIAFTMIVRLGTIIPFALFLSLLAVAAPIVAFAAPGDLHMLSLANALHVTPPVMGAGFTCISFGFILLLWVGFYRKKALFLFCSYAAAGTYFLLSFLFSKDQYWSRAFYFMIIALTCMYLPSWEDLVQSRNKKAHALAIGVFGVIMSLMLLGIMVVYITQINVMTAVKKENVQKVDLARTMMESDIENIKSTLSTAALDPSLISAIDKNNTETFTALSRIIFDSSHSIARIIIMDKNGMALFFYPLGLSDQTDLSPRDYFVRARDTGTLYVSDFFEASANQSYRKVVTVSVPLFTATKEFTGVLAASLDLQALSARLQKIAAVDRGEYVVVLDSHGKRIMHPVQSLIGTDTEPDDPALLGIQGKTGTAFGNTYDGINALIAYTSVSPLHWSIALKAPVNQIYALASTANLIVVGLLIGCIAIAALIFQLVYRYRYRSDTHPGGSP